jgi:hypothetical protein
LVDGGGVAGAMARHQVHIANEVNLGISNFFLFKVLFVNISIWSMMIKDAS